MATNCTIPDSNGRNSVLDSGESSDSSLEDLTSEQSTQSSQGSISVSANEKRKSADSLTIRAQKHLVSRVICSQTSMKPLIGRTASRALKAYEVLLKLHIQATSEVKEIMRAIIKTIVKVGIVVKQHKLTDEQIQFARTARQNFRIIALTTISFTRVSYTYDRPYLDKVILDCQQTLKRCVTDLLSENSHDRIDLVFNRLRSPQLLDSIFSEQATKEQRQALVELCDILEILVNPKPQT
ncbi:hypothetical protein CRM22_009619 [Opisthorchis felineus]|uniref:Tumor necrosis factor alpha-induced protein 8-like protein 2 n=1 Tax=Opisthorchis felineus TaxID=147828 RepID=A0A4S2L6B5_OPIFE|nr:hypothetical protein CRM22_009619 [Opisthorchis felineus]TGZ58486.1 hypothetical protein CRM22_009619 [Opisthorchis felineus]